MIQSNQHPMLLCFPPNLQTRAFVVQPSLNGSALCKIFFNVVVNEVEISHDQHCWIWVEYFYIIWKPTIKVKRKNTKSDIDKYKFAMAQWKKAVITLSPVLIDPSVLISHASVPKKLWWLLYYCVHPILLCP